MGRDGLRIISPPLFGGFFSAKISQRELETTKEAGLSVDFGKYMTRQHLVDVTEIYNQLRWEKKKRFIKVGYLILLFLISVFWLVWSIADGDD